MSLERIEPGDRVEYVTIGLNLGASPYSARTTEIVTGRGTVIDVIRGEAGRAEFVISTPDGQPIGGVRVDFRVDGEAQPVVRLLGTGE